MVARRLIVPVLATRREVLLPGVLVPLEIGRPPSIRAIDHAHAEQSPLLLVPQLEPETQNPTAEDLHDSLARKEPPHWAARFRSTSAAVCCQKAIRWGRRALPISMKLLTSCVVMAERGRLKVPKLDSPM